MDGISIYVMGTFIILNWYQDAQLKKTEKASSSTALVSEESQPGPSSSSMSSQEEQTSEQPTVVQSEALGRGSPIDLSTKKSPESTTETASTTTTTSQGINHFLFITTGVKPSICVCVCPRAFWFSVHQVCLNIKQDHFHL